MIRKKRKRGETLDKSVYSPLTLILQEWALKVTLMTSCIVSCFFTGSRWCSSCQAVERKYSALQSKPSLLCFVLQGCMRLECILLMSATLLTLGVHWIMRPAEGQLVFTLCKRCVMVRISCDLWKHILMQVIPMLPRVLCEHLCSLNPDEVWKLHNYAEPMIINTVY